MLRSAAFSLLLPASLLAQQPAPVTAIKAGALIDGAGGAPVQNAVILVQGERITAAGANVAVPRGATVIDLSAFTVLPGLIDAHVHLRSEEHTSELQSPYDLVCRLLLEKKNKTKLSS